MVALAVSHPYSNYLVEVSDARSYTDQLTVRCDKLAFGVYSVPQCERGLTRLLPDDIIRVPSDYACSLKGKWIPHDVVGDCSGIFLAYYRIAAELDVEIDKYTAYTLSKIPRKILALSKKP